MVSFNPSGLNNLTGEDLLNYANQQFAEVKQELTERSNACHQSLDTIEANLHLAGDIFKEFSKENADYQSDLYELKQDLKAIGSIAHLAISATATLPLFFTGNWIAGSGCIAQMIPSATMLILYGDKEKTIKEMQQKESSLTKLQAIELYEVVKIIINKSDKEETHTIEIPELRTYYIHEMRSELVYNPIGPVMGTRHYYVDVPKTYWTGRNLPPITWKTKVPNDRYQSMDFVLKEYVKRRAAIKYPNFTQLLNELREWAILLPAFHF